MTQGICCPGMSLCPLPDSPEGNLCAEDVVHWLGTPSEGGGQLARYLDVVPSSTHSPNIMDTTSKPSPVLGSRDPEMTMT